MLRPDGAGKSTTIKMLTGILQPTGGFARVLGLDPSKERKRLAWSIGSVFGQKSQLWFHRRLEVLCGGKLSAKLKLLKDLGIA